MAMAASAVNTVCITREFADSLSKLGFEVHPLKVGWYNSVLSPTHHLAYPADTLAVVVLSTPSMFEDAFLPFLKERGFEGLSDPVDQCVRHCVSSAVFQCFPGQKVDVRYDYELFPSRKPKFLAQTAAHVSGAAFYYQQSDVKDQPWAKKKMFGVCVHPRFGGWFAIRALLIFDGVTAGSETVQPVPPDCVPSREERIRLLEAFNFHWQDWTYRDVVPAVHAYSQKQRDYFSTPPAQRTLLLKNWGYVPKETDGPEQTPEPQIQLSGHG